MALSKMLCLLQIWRILFAANNSCKNPISSRRLPKKERFTIASRLLAIRFKRIKVRSVAKEAEMTTLAPFQVCRCRASQQVMVHGLNCALEVYIVIIVLLLNYSIRSSRTPAKVDIHKIFEACIALGVLNKYIQINVLDGPEVNALRRAIAEVKQRCRVGQSLDG
jgi:hypothetical protein